MKRIIRIEKPVAYVEFEVRELRLMRPRRGRRRKANPARGVPLDAFLRR